MNPADDAEAGQEPQKNQRWVKVEGTRMGPASRCDLCGRARTGVLMSDPALFADSIFRRVRASQADGTVRDVTVCGVCFEAHRPLEPRLQDRTRRRGG